MSTVVKQVENVAVTSRPPEMYHGFYTWFGSLWFAQFPFCRLLMLTFVDLLVSLSFVDLVAAVSVSEGRVVKVL